MRNVALIGACLLGVWSAGVQSQQQQSINPAQLATPAAREPAWAFPVQQGVLPAEAPGPKSLPGSTKTYTPEAIDNLLAPPDWLPDDHPPAPAIVQKGHGGALACGSCHLMSGTGHPESADLAGMPEAYLTQQMTDFRSGIRKDVARMNGIAKEVSDDEVREASAWFASLKPRRLQKVVEADTVPKTFVGQGRMRFVDPAGGTEPIGSRIITVPVDVTRARLRDPNSEFVSYVPAGALARGQTLVETGDRSRTIIACGTCHGKTMQGQVMPRRDTPGIPVPRLGGQHPIYIARELYLFKDGSRGGDAAKLMTPTVANMTDEDILAISAYLASLDPTQ